MKKLFSTITVVAFLTVFMSLSVRLSAQQITTLEVRVSAICENVHDLEPEGVGVSFDPSVGKLYCFTKVIGALTPTQIAHVWYFNDTERARINLSVNSPSWRTCSSKIIQSHEIGSWRVDVLNSDGNILKMIQFIVKPQPEAISAIEEPGAVLEKPVPAEVAKEVQSEVAPKVVESASEAISEAVKPAPDVTKAQPNDVPEAVESVSSTKIVQPETIPAPEP